MLKKVCCFLTLCGYSHGFLFSMSNKELTPQKLQEIVQGAIQNQNNSPYISKTVHPSREQTSNDPEFDDLLNQWEEKFDSSNNSLEIIFFKEAVKNLTPKEKKEKSELLKQLYRLYNLEPDEE